MSYDEALALRIRALLADRSDVVERKMCGGLCFMVNGRMCCGLTKTDFMVRVGPEQYEEALSRPHARPMDFTGRPLTGMVHVTPRRPSHAGRARVLDRSRPRVRVDCAAKPSVGETSCGAFTGRGSLRAIGLSARLP